MWWVLIWGGGSPAGRGSISELVVAVGKHTFLGICGWAVCFWWPWVDRWAQVSLGSIHGSTDLGWVGNVAWPGVAACWLFQDAVIFLHAVSTCLVGQPGLSWWWSEKNIKAKSEHNLSFARIQVRVPDFIRPRDTMSEVSLYNPGCPGTHYVYRPGWPRT